MKQEHYEILVESKDEFTKNQWLSGFRANFENYENGRHSVPWRPVVEWFGVSSANVVLACQHLEEMGIAYTLAWDERNMPMGQEMGWVVVRDYFPHEQPNLVNDIRLIHLTR